MYEPERRNFIEKHDFFVKETHRRIISQFADIEGEADNFADKWLESSSAYFDNENDDPASFFENANEKAMEFYFLISDMKKNAILAMTASIFHHWDKSFRSWLVKELKFSITGRSVSQIWTAPITDIADFFKFHGWDMMAEPSMSRIIVLHDVVNAYKHGEGRSFKRVAEKNPEYLDDFLIEMNNKGKRIYKPSYENLCVRENQFDDFCDAIKDFWKSVPKELCWRNEED